MLKWKALISLIALIGLVFFNIFVINLNEELLTLGRKLVIILSDIIFGIFSIGYIVCVIKSVFTDGIECLNECNELDNVEYNIVIVYVVGVFLSVIIGFILFYILAIMGKI